MPKKTTKTKVIKKAGKKPISFKVGGLHKSLGIPAGRKIPQRLLKEAIAGKHGTLAQKQARFKENVLTGSK